MYCAGVPWDAVQGTDRQLARSLARTVDVLWVDPPLSALLIASRGQIASTRRAGRLRPVDDHITRLITVAPPFPTRSAMLPVTQQVMRRAIRRAVRELGLDVAATIVSNPLQPLRVVATGRQVYFATDDFVAGAALMGSSRSMLVRSEAARLGEADLLIGVTPQIVDAWRGRGVSSMVLPNGCDLDAYARVDEAPPVGDVALTSPIAGVVGQLSARLDLALIEEVASRGISVLLVGPLQDGFEPERFASLIARPNVTWVGAKKYTDLPSYLRLMDVGLTPYVDSAFNRASFPLKTLEYLAAGRPVVSTPLPAVDHLDTSLIEVGADPAGFAAATWRAIELAEMPSTNARARTFAAQHSWDARATQLWEAIERA